MVALMDLWLPILLSAVFVFVVSSIIHMAIPLHKGDYKKLPGEAEIRASIRGQGATPGSYMFPNCSSMKEMGSAEMTAKLNEGPVGYMILIPNGPFRMGKALTTWFIYSIVIGIFVGYIGTFSLGPGATYGMVFRVTGTAAILGYALNSVVDSIWKGVSWAITAKFIFDGIVYGLVTAGTFGWLWPAA